MNETTMKEVGESLTSVFEEFDRQRKEQAKKERRKRLFTESTRVSYSAVSWASLWG
jgi:hypothetical protein